MRAGRMAILIDEEDRGNEGDLVLAADVFIYVGDLTAVLAGVNVFNPDGSPYIGEWQLVSANGYDYPEIFLQASSGVSAPC